MKPNLPRRLAPVLPAAALSLLAACMPPVAQTQPVVPPSAPPAIAAAATNLPDVAPVTPRRIAPQPVALSPGVAEAIVLVQAGVEDSVIKAHMANSTNAFNPSVNELIYLNDIGVPAPLVSGLLQQAAKLREQAAALAAQTNQVAAANTNRPAAPVAPAPAAPAAQPIAPAAPQPPAVVTAPVQPAPVEVVVVPASAPVQVNYFYQTLAPYGSWVELRDYGWCWQPTVAIGTPRWRPYCDRGRWIFTDAGWYWQSDYSWGWAPFHYGRWVLDGRCGWVWVPDLAWAPAWVTWRHSGTHCGWAALPPGCEYFPGRGLVHRGVNVTAAFDFGLSANHFTFVSWDRFHDRTPFLYTASPTQAKAIYNQTTVINNYTVANNIIVNHGVPIQQVAALTRMQLKPVAVRNTPANAAGIKPDRLEKDGTQTVIYRPQLALPITSSAGVSNSGVTKNPAPVPTAPISVGVPAKAVSRTPGLRPAEELHVTVPVKPAAPAVGVPAPAPVAPPVAATPPAKATAHSPGLRPAEEARLVVAPPGPAGHAVSNAPTATGNAIKHTSVIKAASVPGAPAPQPAPAVSVPIPLNPIPPPTRQFPHPALPSTVTPAPPVIVVPTAPARSTPSFSPPPAVHPAPSYTAPPVVVTPPAVGNTPPSSGGSRSSDSDKKKP